MWQDRLKKIIEMLETSDVNEIEISFWGRKFRVSKGTVSQNNPTSGSTLETVTVAPVTPSLDTTSEVPSVETRVEINGVEVKAPMVGTFYTAPSPESPSYVTVGDYVSTGQILCIIEAMKIMNEIESEVAGQITKILVENSQPVEYGQPLFIIEPD